MKRFAVLATCCLSLHAHAEFFDGNKLLARIKGDTYDYANAIGYVIGVADMMRNIAHCPPDNITAGQILDMVKQHLEDNPSTRHFTGDQHVVYVLKKAWPCAKKGSGV